MFLNTCSSSIKSLQINTVLFYSCSLTRTHFQSDLFDWNGWRKLKIAGDELWSRVSRLLAVHHTHREAGQRFLLQPLCKLKICCCWSFWNRNTTDAQFYFCCRNCENPNMTNERLLHTEQRLGPTAQWRQTTHAHFTTNNARTLYDKQRTHTLRQWFSNGSYGRKYFPDLSQK